MRGQRAGGNAVAEAQHQAVLRAGAQQRRQVPQQVERAQAEDIGGHLDAPVHRRELGMAGGGLEDGHRRFDALLVKDEIFGRILPVAQVPGRWEQECRHDRSDEHGDGGQPLAQRCRTKEPHRRKPDTQVEGRQRERRVLQAQRRNDDKAGQQRSQDGPGRVQGSDASHLPPHPLGPFGRVEAADDGEDGADQHRHREERDEGQQPLKGHLRRDRVCAKDVLQPEPGQLGKGKQHQDGEQANPQLQAPKVGQRRPPPLHPLGSDEAADDQPAEEHGQHDGK